jgi:YVTN family beta-propeller protein
MKKSVLFFVAAIMMMSVSCSKTEEPEVPVVISDDELIGIYVCCEGLFNLNNGTLTYYDLNNSQLYKDYFLLKNHRGIGDTPNDLKSYGSKLYCVVNISNMIEVIDANTGVSIKQIPVVNENGIGRQPRYITFFENHGFVCNFDGTVIVIDTASLEVEKVIQCGKNPNGICASKGKLFVSNSGGLYFPNYDNTVSVIDIASFKEEQKITVAPNPGKLQADSEGDIYVVSCGNYNDIPYTFQRIDHKTYNVQAFQHINALNFTICNDTAYLYSYDFSGGNSWIKRFDCKTEQITNEQFISDGTIIQTPYNINVNPQNGDVYITDAYNITIQGDLHCFDRNGKQKFVLSNIGLNPNNIVFLNQKIISKSLL